MRIVQNVINNCNMIIIQMEIQKFFAVIIIQKFIRWFCYVQLCQVTIIGFVN